MNSLFFLIKAAIQVLKKKEFLILENIKNIVIKRNVIYKFSIKIMTILIIFFDLILSNGLTLNRSQSPATIILAKTMVLI